MRKPITDSGFSVRLRVSEALGREIHQMSLRENRSQSSAISILVTEALNARRAKSANDEELLRAGMQSKLAKIIRGVADSYSPDQAA
jgi:hypothetical protein